MEFLGSERGSAEASLAFVIKLRGEFDLSDLRRLRDAFSIPRSADLVVLDLQAVSYIDSNVQGCIIELRSQTNKRGARLVLAGVAGGVRRIFEVCDFERLFQLEEDLATVRRNYALEASNLRILTLTSGASAEA